MSPPRRRPAHLGSTYRLQVHGLGFKGATELVEYLSALGIETLYLAPVLRAEGGSTHGYDVVDPTELDPALGTRDEFAALEAALAERAMGLLLDIVPNHMAASVHNAWWWDVLANGESSAFAHFFDVDWEAQEGKVLLPVLGAPLGEVLAEGTLTLAEGAGGTELAHFEQRFPLAAGSAHLLDELRGPRGDRRRRAVEALLDAQHYRLSYWRLGRDEGNYRRFFDIDTLVGLRIEDPAVVRATHALVLELVADPVVVGVRVDHVDGLADPAGYLGTLRTLLGRRSAGAGDPVVLIEKILGPGERLPGAWATDGTTGYEFADWAGSLLVDPTGLDLLAAGSAELAGGTPFFAELALEAKREVLATLFPGQVRRLARLARTLAELDGHLDLAEARFAAAIAELVANLDVYRIYADEEGASAEDRGRLERASELAGASLDAEERRAARALVGWLVGGAVTKVQRGWPLLELRPRFSQLSGAVAAKGVEDTALYRYDGLLAVAEVGEEPGRRPLEPAEFLAAIAAREVWPRSLNALSTHDTKRSGDVRARLAVLSEVPERWLAQVQRWHDALGSSGAVSIGPHDELFIYQCLFGGWPGRGPESKGFARRVEDTAVKSAREAKRRTSWLDPDEHYEQALGRFIRRALRRTESPVPGDLDELVADLGPASATNALSLLVLQMTTPGVPDLYQGTELWSRSFVDPDNRRPVDFARRRRLLAEVNAWLAEGQPPVPWLSDPTDDRLKLAVTRVLLDLRRRRRATFDDAPSVPVSVRGRHASHLVAFARPHREGTVVVIAPRHTYALAGAGTWAVGEAWADTSIPLDPEWSGPFTNVVNGASVVPRRGALRVRDVLATVPVGVLSAP